MTHNPEMSSGAEAIGTPAELEQLYGRHDYMISIGTGNAALMADGLDMVKALGEQFGRQNVLVSPISRDPDTLLLTRRVGRLGIFVLKEDYRAEPEDIL